MKQTSQKVISKRMEVSSEMTFIDAHVHFWDPAKTPRAVTPLVKALGSSPRLVDEVARLVFPKDVRRFYSRSEYITRPYVLL